MKTLFYCKIQVEHHAVKKNGRKIMRNRRTGTSFLGKSSKLVSAENYLTHAILRAKITNGPSEPITCDVNARFVFYVPESKYYVKAKKKTDAPRRSKTLGDLSNLYQLPEDILQVVGVYENDSQIQGHDGSRIKPSIDENYYLLIDLTEFVHEDESK